MKLYLRLTVAVLCFAAILTTCGISVWAAEPPAPSETWMGMYLGTSKIGHACITQGPEERKGTTVVKTETTSETEMVVLGATLKQSIRTTVFTDVGSQPVYQEFRMSSGGKTTEVYADFLKDRIEARLVTDSGETTKTIPIPEGVALVGDTYNPSTPDKITVGHTYKRRAFNPLTLTLDELVIAIDRTETIEHRGKKVEAIVMVTKTPLADMSSWLADGGKSIIKIEAPMGIVMLEEPKQEALRIQKPGYKPPQDFAVLTSVSANMDLPEDKPVNRLHIKLLGLPGADYIFKDSRQHVQEQSADGKSVTYVIRAGEVDVDGAGTLPVSDEKMKQFLKSGPYLDTESPEVKNTAARVIGSETNLIKASELLRKWINAQMTPESNMGILRPATDVIKHPKGVCRDYAILFAALARSAGIPTRLVAGLVYARGGLYYHAWNEVWSGKEWLSVDSTLSSSFVDATHIKLADGEPADMFKLAKIVGQLEAEILAFD